MDPDKPPALPAPHPSVRGARTTSPTPPSAAGTGVRFLAPVVLRVLSLRSSPAPVGYFDATPDPEGVSWPGRWHFSPTRAIRSFTTPAWIWMHIVGSWAWYRQSSPLIVCRTTSFLLGRSFWRISLLLLPPTPLGPLLWPRTLHLPLPRPAPLRAVWRPLYTLPAFTRWHPVMVQQEGGVMVSQGRHPLWL